jgi:RsiW-degrading membrane proteinase PrsW (M82 family)
MATAGSGVPEAPRSGRTPLGFIAGLAGACLVAVVVLVIVVGGGPVPELVGLALAILPVPLVTAGVLYLDRLEPEPPSLLAAVFFAGAAAAVLIALAGYLFQSQLITTPQLSPHVGRLISTTAAAAIGGAVVAETLKGAVLVVLLRYRRAELDGAHDGVVYACVTGLGFALAANLYAYLRAEHSGIGALASAFMWRGILGPLWDPLFTSLIGLGVGYAALRRGRSGWWAIGVGWVFAVALHAMWNASAGAGAGQIAVVYLILVAVLAAMVVAVVADRHRIVTLINGYLPAYQSADLIAASDVEMLASLPWRRQARQWARLHVGLAGGKAMIDYQLAATELALACRRTERELMTPAAFDNYRDDSLIQMQAAVSVFRNHHPQLQRPPWAPRTPSAFALAGPPHPDSRAAREQPA